MNLEAIYFISQVIAACAIVASLIFVGLQVRQANSQQRTLISMNRAEWIERIMDRFSSAENAEVYFKGVRASSDLTDVEAQRFVFMVMTQFDGWQERHREWQAGVLSKDRWEQSHGALRGFLRLPGYRAAYRAWAAGAASPDFAALAERIIHDEKPDPDLNLAAIWKMFAASEHSGGSNTGSAANPEPRKGSAE